MKLSRFTPKLPAAIIAFAGLITAQPSARAQNATGINTFSGEVAATCSITNLDETYELEWKSGGLRKSAPFTINANTAVTASLSYEKVQTPENANPSEIFTLYQDNTQLFSLRDSPNTNSTPQQINLDAQNNASMSVSVILYKGSIYKSIPPGSYTYRITLSCLQ